jgi:hypothetical protein
MPKARYKVAFQTATGRRDTFIEADSPDHAAEIVMTFGAREILSVDLHDIIVDENKSVPLLIRNGELSDSNLNVTLESKSGIGKGDEVNLRAGGAGSATFGGAVLLFGLFLLFVSEDRGLGFFLFLMLLILGAPFLVSGLYMSGALSKRER